MAEEELRILIKAVDETSAVVKDIENSLNGQIKSLIAVGNATASVDRITSAYTNLQLRLENASERVAGAQDRLAQAQYNLSKVQKDSSSTAEDLSEAQRQVESASRGLTVAQNNLARANNAVIGTYINIGVQSPQFVQSLPVAIRNLQALTAASWAFIATPLGAAMLAIGAATAIVVTQKQKLKEIDEEIVSTNEKLKETQDNLTDSTYGYLDAVKAVRDEMLGQLTAPTERGLTLKRDIANTKAEIAEMEAALASAKNGGPLAPSGANAKLAQKKKDLDVLKAQYEAEVTSYNDVVTAEIDLRTFQAEEEKKLQSSIFDSVVGNRKAALDYIQNTWSPRIENVQNALYDNEIKKLQDLQTELDKAYQKKERLLGYGAGTGSANSNAMGIPMASSTTAQKLALGSGTGQSKVTKVNDAIIKPNGNVISTHPDDYLIATKDPESLNSGNGLTIIIQGDMYGLDGKQVARTLYDMLRKKISV